MKSYCFRHHNILKLHFLFIATIIALIFSVNVSYGAIVVDLVHVETGRYPEIQAYVTVVDGNGDPITSLTASNFSILEDGNAKTPKSVTYFPPSLEPVAVALALDYSGSMVDAGAIGPMKTAALGFIEQLRTDPPDACEIIKFDWNISVEQGFTSDKGALSDAVQRVWTTDLTGTKLYDAIYKAIEDTRDYVTSSGGVGSVVVVSEGKDENNDIGGPGSEHSRHELIDLAYNNGIRIFTVGVGSVIEGVLKEIAYETGGSYFYAPTPSDLTTVPSAIAAQFYGTYVVFYDTSITNCQDHTLEISVTANTESGVDSESFRTCAQDLDVNPSEINFGSVDTGEIKTTNVTLCNLGIPYLTVDAISAPNEPFSLTTVPPLPATLGQGNCIEFAVTFAPTAPGDFTDNVTITSNDPDEPSFNIPLSGTGISPADISITPLNINFGDVLLGDPKTTNVTITNEGTLDLTVISIAEPVDPFSLSTVPALPAVIASGGSIVFGVTFAPTGRGDFNSAITVLSDDEDEPSIDVVVSGRGIWGDIAIDPLVINFGSVTVGDSQTTDVTISNMGDSDLTVTSISPPGDPFSLSTVPALPAVIASGGSIVFGVTFAPTEASESNATVTVVSDDKDEPSIGIALSGRGIWGDIAIDPLVINFGSVTVGDSQTTNVTISNMGDSDLTVTSISDPGDPFSLSTVPDLPAVIASGGSIVFGVTFAPTEAGGFDATVIVASDDQDEPSIGIPLSGTAKSSLTIESPQGPITVATSKGVITNLSLVDVSTLPAEGKPNASFPYGLFSFSIEGLPVGTIPERVNIEITLPGNLSTDAQYWKCGPKTAGGPDEWYSIQLGSNDGDNIVTIQVEDGGLGDGDCEQDGSIVDPGGPAITAGAPSGGGGGGGCSMSNPEGQINIGHQLIFVGIFALGLLVWRERRRR